MRTFAPDPVQYTYTANHTSLGTVSPGERFTVLTEDGFTARYADPANFRPETAAWVGENLDGVTGPIAVAGCEAGEAVAVTIETLEVTTPGCVVVSRCEARSPLDWWQEEDHVVNLPVADGRIELDDGWTAPARPLIGCLATAPARETVFSKYEGNDYLGNVDCREITAGATIILPVSVDGAWLYFGDCKAAMADGEVVAAPEVGTRIVASARPVKRPASMGATRILTEDRLTTVVSGISLADACRAAFAQLKLWIQDEWALTHEQAAIVMGIGGACGVGQVSNRCHTAKCSLDRALLPETTNEPH